MSSPIGDEKRVPPSAQPREFRRLSPEGSLQEERLHSSSQQAEQDPAQAAKIQAASSSSGAAEAAEDSARPNKYKGAKSTWRDWTAEERRIAASLEQVQAQDLSIHLFNTHALRLSARAQRGSLQQTGTVSGTAKLKTDIWEPPKMWAAWPLPADEVPREVEKAGLDPGPNDPPASSRRDLEEILLATATRLARERFEAREWESAGSENESMQEASAGSDTLVASDMNAMRLEQGAQVSAPGEQGAGSEPPSFPSESSSIDSAVSVILRPVPLADDNVAANLLLPSIRHVMANNLDRLLYALHRTRASYAGPDAPISSDDGSRSPSVASMRSGARSRQATPAPVPMSPRKRKRAGSESEGDALPPSEDDEGGVSDARVWIDEGRVRRGRTRKVSSSVASTSGSERSGVSREHMQSSRKRRARLGLRDWSEVLGLAAIQGWDAGVIERARRRCSELLGEDMNFMTLEMPDLAENNA